MFEPMFIPPRDNPRMVRVVNAVLPHLAQVWGSVRDVKVAPDDLERLRNHCDGRGIIAPNHPTGEDPVVIYWVSKLAERRFNYLACREILDGWKGWLLNQLGTYSVIRGVPDRESLRTTRKLLAELDRTVVIFPEGEIYEHNDTLLAFQSGVAQIGFWALDDLTKSGKNPCLPITPLAIKYRILDSPRPAIENSLRALERALHLEEAPPKATAYARLLRIGDQVLVALERDVGLKPQPGGDLKARISAARQAMLEQVAHAINTTLDTRQPPADQLHLLFHALKSWVGLLPDGHNEYDERLYRRKMEVAAPLFRDLQRLQNFIAITGDYVAAEATAERFLEVLGRLEVEVFGELRYRVPREALVRVGEPIRLEERYAEYKERKREVVLDVTRTMEGEIRGLLRELSRESTPISLGI